MSKRRNESVDDRSNKYLKSLTGFSGDDFFVLPYNVQYNVFSMLSSDQLLDLHAKTKNVKLRGVIDQYFQDFINREVTDLNINYPRKHETASSVTSYWRHLYIATLMSRDFTTAEFQNERFNIMIGSKFYGISEEWEPVMFILVPSPSSYFTTSFISDMEQIVGISQYYNIDYEDYSQSDEEEQYSDNEYQLAIDYTDRKEVIRMLMFLIHTYNMSVKYNQYDDNRQFETKDFIRCSICNFKAVNKCLDCRGQYFCETCH